MGPGLRAELSGALDCLPLGGQHVARPVRVGPPNGVVALLCDLEQGPGVTVRFFGRRSVVPGGPAAIALKTGNPAAVNSTFLLFFPFLFLTSSYVPRSQLSGWLSTVAKFNPVTYLLGGLRSLEVGGGAQWVPLGQALLAVGIVALISMTLCFAALRGRVKRA